jgi:uncharacterized protein YoxC
MYIYNNLDTGTLQDFSNTMVEKGNELQKVNEDSRKLAEKLSLQKEKLEEKNAQALSFQRNFHDSFEKVLKKQKCDTHREYGFGA